MTIDDIMVNSEVFYIDKFIDKRIVKKTFYDACCILPLLAPNWSSCTSTAMCMGTYGISADRYLHIYDDNEKIHRIPNINGNCVFIEKEDGLSIIIVRFINVNNNTHHMFIFSEKPVDKKSNKFLSAENFINNL